LNDTDQQRIQITSPYHPLCGQTLKIQRRIQSLNSEPQLVVELPNGHTQLIAARWLEFPPSSSSPGIERGILFSADSLRSLVIMTTSLIQQQQPEACDECTPNEQSVADLSSGTASTTDVFVDRTPVPTPASATVAAHDRRQR
jgi:hypothetical protein